MQNILSSQNLEFSGLKMLQLGDQMYREKKIRAKKHFEDMGLFVLSIDINGQGESLPIDLSKPINWPQYKGYFDIVTNFGTSEHVSDHMTCFENIYYFCKNGGIMYNLVPREGCWNKGCHKHAHKYNTEFFKSWAGEHFCTILENRVVDSKERFRDDMVLAVLRK